MDKRLLAKYREMQEAARQTVAYLARTLRPGMTLAQVRGAAEERLLALGADSFWYHGIGAFVFAGEDTARSLSGRDYRTPSHVLGEDDLLTVDLSPQKNGLWGDFARTLVWQGGVVAQEPAQVQNALWRQGLEMEDLLHGELRRFAAPDTSFEALHAHMNAFIADHGFVNLDFHGNLGHTIELRPDDRLYIEKGNAQPLGEGRLFTFEPHIAAPGSPYGFKKENIYYFENGEICEL